MSLRAIAFNDSGQLRNGWWMVIFILFIAVTRLLYKPVTAILDSVGATEGMLEPIPFLFVLLVTWICVRLRRESLASVGFDLGGRWFRHVLAGTIVGTGAMLAIVGLIALTGGVRFELNPGRSVEILMYGLYLFLFASLLEETLFRGFLFQRLVSASSPRIALIAFALLFAAAHWGNPGMHGATRIWATVDTALGAVLLGLAYLRTGSLALPVGIHLGWNWAQGYLLGFGVSGYGQTGWFRPLFQDRAEWITGGPFGPEASVFAVAVDLMLVAVLWRWKAPAALPLRAVRAEAVPSS